MAAPPHLLRAVTSSRLGSFSISAKTGSGGVLTEAGEAIFRTHFEAPHFSGWRICPTPRGAAAAPRFCLV